MRSMARRDDQESRPKGTYDLEALEELIASLLEASGQGAAVIRELECLGGGR